ncbi:putative ATP-dependent helicase [Glutamicibacter arilaitensis Re117]|uniref:ATP-dependent helicase n=2 Tax=Glutamicibacter arilaitensis TaxID=256701 RepID=A0ABM9Q0Z5_GLUAR|nr:MULTISPECIES: DEAD/DEAH box helicase [Glutamicibacter]CBT77369.1 putative ATP-dependent helicase [Glutamicibacter arilaitensis Re117]
MMALNADIAFTGGLSGDVTYGFLDGKIQSRRHHHPRVVLNADGNTVLRILREELARCDEFIFSVAFVTPNAIAMLKQELVEFSGRGTIVTSDYLGFNSPSAFSELLNLANLGIDVRIHSADAFHPKGYIFKSADVVTAMIGSSNLTGNAIVKNHEWNLKVTAANNSDLAVQLADLAGNQLADSQPLSQEWIDLYAAQYTPPPPRKKIEIAKKQEQADEQLIDEVAAGLSGSSGLGGDINWADQLMPILPNQMQSEALKALEKVRLSGESKAIVISATGTGKTILSALEVRAAHPQRFLFVVHREQILDKTMKEYRRVIGGDADQFGKLAGVSKQSDRKYVFATVQTLSQDVVLQLIEPDTFDYVIVDEAHRVGSPTYKKVLAYLKPKFLLGLTATPERSDGFNVFEFFDYNVPYEIRLNHALEENMLSPFHYYGIADVTLDDESVRDSSEDLSHLVTADRVHHVVDALTKYGQAGAAPKGLIFCSRKDEANALSAALNQQKLRGKALRTLSLSGDDSIERREQVVSQLEAGDLDYILTVDIFNEGVDIPSVNQVVMLRQTQSAIVFVQQLGRGLRKAPMKDYLVVIDFIGNYANNYMIPIALFGDESLNKESLKEKLIATEQAGVMAGLSSIRFDKIAQQRVLDSIRTTALDSIQKLRGSMQAMQNRVGQAPRLFDFYRFKSVDPVLLATKKENYPTLVKSLLSIDHDLGTDELRALSLLSHEVLTSKRIHEFVLVRELLSNDSITFDQFAAAVREYGLEPTKRELLSAVETLSLANHAQVDQTRYGIRLASIENDSITPDAGFRHSYRTHGSFTEEVDDLLQTGVALVSDRYIGGYPFIVGGQYSRKEVTRLLGVPRKWTSTLYGYKVDMESKTCPIFVTLHKSEDVSASTAYQDELVDPSHLRWFTRSRRTLTSDEVRRIVNNEVDLHVFVKKDDAEGTEFFYLGKADSRNAQQAKMAGKDNEPLDVVTMDLHFEDSIDSALYDYLSPNSDLT